MKVKHLIFYALTALVVSATVSSCAEEKEGYVQPDFGELTQEPNPVSPGEEVTLTISQNSKGNGIAGVTYNWTIYNLVPDATGQVQDLVLSEHTNYDGYDKKDPTITFKVPENVSAGAYIVSMQADYQCYMDNVLFDVSPTVSGKLTVK